MGASNTYSLYSMGEIPSRGLPDHDSAGSEKKFSLLMKKPLVLKGIYPVLGRGRHLSLLLRAGSPLVGHQKGANM